MFVGGSSKKSKAADSETANITNTSENKIDWEIPQQYPTTLRDPMKAGTSAASSSRTGELVVRGIVYSQDNPSAVIGTQVIFEGEEIFGATITKINTDSVEFEKDGETWTQKIQN